MGVSKRRHGRAIEDLPDGAFVALQDGAYAVRGGFLLHWTPEGYDARKRRPSGLTVDVLTPPAVLSVLAAGYRPAVASERCAAHFIAALIASTPLPDFAASMTFASLPASPGAAAFIGSMVRAAPPPRRGGRRE